MYRKSKNGLLFAVFILVVLLIISILVISVHNFRSKDKEEYKISLNNSIYDKNYGYISLKDDAILKKEWDNNYYLYESNSQTKYDLGTEPVFYDKSKKQISIFGTVYQVYSNGDISKKTKKTTISSLNEFQFFKLNDRKYLIIGDNIVGDNFKAYNYLIVSIDKAGNALLLNNEVNIKTIHSLVLSVGNIKFDISNEKLITDEEIDLKKINGSTNEYVEEVETKKADNNNDKISTNENTSTTNNFNTTKVYNDIVKQIISLGNYINGTSSNNKTNLYKNISIREVNPGASYIEVKYSIIDPEERYLSVFLTLKDSNENINYYYLNKDSNSYTISGLSPNNRYEVSINYIQSGSSEAITSDTVVVLTNNDPTKVRITKISGNTITYNVKMYNEYEFQNAYVVLISCDTNQVIASKPLDIYNALSNNGVYDEFQVDSNLSGCVCLQLLDLNNEIINKNSYHKVILN